MASPHVLLVDDSHVDRHAASRVLESCGFIVTAVASIGPAMSFLAKNHFVHLILAEYSMPDMTGYDLLLEVKNSPRLSHIPVVIASTDYIHERVQMCLEGGAVDFITKPIEVADVARLRSYM